MHGNSRLVSYSALSALATSLAFSGWGCSPAPQPTASLPAPIVAVSAPKRQTSAAYEYFTGQAEALERVDVNSRISGHLIAIHFKPGPK